MPPRYPLDALHRVREDRVEARQRELSEQLSAQQGAERRANEAAVVRAREAEVARVTRAAEGEELDQGAARVVDLARLGTWEIAAEGRLAELGATEKRALEAAQAAAAESERRRFRLAQADAGLKAVERHRGEWKAGLERSQEMEREEQAQDQWTARLVGSRGPC